VPPAPLPIDPYLHAVRTAVGRHRAAVVTAPPGAGKTTRVPPALAADGPVVVLEPRRVAARAIARRIAAEQGWTIGEEVGWHVRFERRAGPRTRLVVATEGILTARLQRDPLLSGVRTVVLDEFHERSLHADVGLALARQAWRARDDLGIVVMSATIDAARIAAFLDDCPVIDVPGRLHPLEIDYAPGASLAEAAAGLVAGGHGDVLGFLPGAPEIRRAERQLRPLLPESVDVVPLHGSLDAEAQDRAIRPGPRRRVILATNIAETSLTVPGVTAVVDTGLHKVARYDPERGIDSLEVERITADSADQRAGRAGRVGPGRVRRLWDARDRLRPHREPEILRVDLAAAALDVIGWGGDPRTLDWFEAPPPEAVDAALALLARLGAVERAPGAPPRLTPLGRTLGRLPLHPRLGRILVAAGGGREAALACALLSERHFLPPRAAATTSDVLSAIDDRRGLPPHVTAVADGIARAAARVLGAAARAHAGETALRRALFEGYADRVARRRAPGSPRVLLASGHGAVVAEESGVTGGEWLVAIDVQAGARGEGREARIRVASQVDREWLTATGTDVEHRFDPASGRVVAVAVERYDALPLVERPVAPDPERAAPLLARAWLDRGPGEADRQLVRRLRFAGHAVELDDLVSRACAGATSVNEVRLARHLPAGTTRDLDRLAPETIAIPSGRSARLEYHDDGTVSASVKLQELFGLAETPRVGPRREPVVLELLAPNGRPVQVTRDLGSFWTRTYPEVRRELRGRYPKHPWPEDPWTATPTARAKRRPPRGRA
jgi:ATP-dependent helicase HrpB